MCGIAGIIKLKGEITTAQLGRLDFALATQSHRGPDAKSSWSNSKVALGHNRLSIIDLSTAANQPLHREDLQLSIIFNGEIYNYQPLKEKLICEGFEFYTTSDTEVLLAAYRFFGEKITEQLVGMFAFVIFDHRTEEIFVARDRFGEKPFFYIQTDSEILFASELIALKKLYAKELTINQDAVVDLMENMYINLQHTIYKEVEVFPPAFQLQINNGQLTWKKYYRFPSEVSHRPGFQILKEEVKNLLFEIVANELHADVPVATFLSSGIDSSVISAISKELKPDILAITMSTGDPHSDETEGAKKFAEKLNIRQEIVTVNPGSLNVLAKLLKNIQPLADASLIPTHLVTEAVSSHTKVMLSGDAGDEVFGSYNKPNLFQEFGGNKVPGAKTMMASIMRFSDSSWEKYLSDKNRFKLGGWTGYYQKNNLSGCFGKVFKKGNPLNRVAQLAEELQSSYLSNPEKLSFGVDFATRLPGDFLFKVDAASMRSSLEVRAPFLDHRLVDLSLGSDMKSLMPNKIDKEITRAIYKDFAGFEHLGSKKGFSIPYLNYLRGDWGRILENYLKEGHSAQFFQFNTKGLLEMLQELRISPRQSLARILFSALVLEIWLRVFHLEQDIQFSYSSK
jgi:asparagine synthase (glutamine-hydrolysing)